MGFIPVVEAGSKIQKSINVVYHINELKKEKIYMTLSVDAGKAFDKIQHQFMIKSTN